MQRHVDTPAEYIAAVPPVQLPLLQHLRSLILAAVPGIREEIRYGMLAYDDAGVLFGLAAQKHYVGLYLGAMQAIVDMAEELKNIDHGKSCLRFRKLESVPTEMISRLLAHAVGVRERDCKKVG
jgi:uncharacterized protein YdhG (YjbR/CyaY superfamily)